MGTSVSPCVEAMAVARVFGEDLALSAETLLGMDGDADADGDGYAVNGAGAGDGPPAHCTMHA
jgi:hypothetical protein